MRFRTLALSLIPGAAHVDLGRAVRGLLFFSFFAFFVNGAIVAPLVLGAREARLVCAVAAAGTWIAALFDSVRLARLPAEVSPVKVESPSKEPVGKQDA